MKQGKVSKAKYTGIEIVRMDVDTTNALNQLAKLTERSKSDAMRWSIRQMVTTITAEKKLSAMKSKAT